MRQNSSRLFIKNDAAYVAVVFVSVILFISFLAIQIFTEITMTRIFVGIGLMFLAFTMNIFEGKFGFYISFALNFVQFMIYTYEYIVMKSESAPVLLAMTIITMVIDMLLQYYIIKIAGTIQGIEAAKSYMVAPSATVLLMDSEAQRFYLKSSDASGMPMPLRVFEYTEIPQNSANKAVDSPAVDLSSYATKAELDAFRDEIQALLKNVSKPVKKEVKEDA